MQCNSLMIRTTRLPYSSPALLCHFPFQTRYHFSMAVPTQLSSFSPSSLSLSAHPVPKSTYSKSPQQTIKYEGNSAIKPPSLKEVCKQGNLRQAFEAFTQIFNNYNLPQLVCPDDAYSSILELCAAKQALGEGKQIHAHIITSNVEHDSAFLGTKLVFMYGKCGSLNDAAKLFDEMPRRTIFSWNAMIGAYVSSGKPLQAVQVYSEMRHMDVKLDACTFPSVFKACGLLNDLRVGSEAHGYIIKSGFDSNGFVVNAIVSMYAKCDNIAGARRLFDRITDRTDVVSWNSIISAYSTCGESIEALVLFREMQQAGVETNTYSFVAVLQAVAKESFRRFGMEIHAVVLKSNLPIHVFVANALVVMYSRCGRIREATEVFNKMIEKDSISWNSMLSGFVQNGLHSVALQFFQEMQAAGQTPDQVSLISILASCGRVENLLNGMEAHAYAIKNASVEDLQVGNTLMDMYSKFGLMKYMDRVFKNMPEKDVISWTTVMAGYAQNNWYTKALEGFREIQLQGIAVDAMMIGSMLLACIGLKHLHHIKEIHSYSTRRGLMDKVMSNTLVDAYGECNDIGYASRVFEMTEDRDVISWTSMISTCVDNNLANEALDLFSSMRESGVEPDFVALVSILNAAASLSALKKGREIHGYLIRQGYGVERSIASSLVDMYARCGTVDQSHKVFSSVENKDIVLWTSMINANGMHGRGEAAIKLFNEMEDERVSPDHITFLALLYACSHTGRAHEGQQFLELMQHKYLLEPWPEHYACVVDLLGRAKRLEEAYKYIRTMPVAPNAVVWCSLLRACHVHSNEELGEIAAQELLKLDPGSPGNYVLISNVFAATGRWDDVEQVRTKMREKGLKKNPACSWIEIQNRVHTFMARDKSHPQTEQIYQKLAEIIRVIQKKGGYVAETKHVLHNIQEEEKVKLLYGHSERLAIAYGLIETSKGTPIRVNKNLRICGDCHSFVKLVSRFFDREIIVRDASRFHHFLRGACSCVDFW